MGVKFRAACTLEITEHAGGAPAALLAPPPAHGGAGGLFGGAAGAARYPWPSQALPGHPVTGDITFDLVSSSDFEAFRGVWRIQAVGQGSAWLTYALFVRPQGFLPVSIIAHQIGEQIRNNLAAVARHSEQRARSSGGNGNGNGNSSGALAA
jgi:hypothetical protein